MTATPSGSADEALQDLVTALSQALGHAFCRISLFDEARVRLHVKAAYTPSAAGPDWRRRLHAEPLLASLVPSGPTVFRRADGKCGRVLDDISARLGTSIQSLLVIPIVENGRVLGVVDLGERRADARTAFDDEAIRFAVAMMADIARVLTGATKTNRQHDCGEGPTLKASASRS